ncbi:hypothetical protein C8J56DRAFT_1064884 [Mycena floridula]|nr:hypothetical protein C8J56DRAFT_1064884 [Mycena floridula]
MSDMKWNLSSASSRFKGYLQKQDLRHSVPNAINRLSPGPQQTWKQWAGQKINAARNHGPGQEQLALFPGWAARRYEKQKQEEAFDVDIFISGFASVRRAPDMASRSQKAFIRLAKGFAALPKLDSDSDSDSEPMVTSNVSRSTEELLATVRLPPRPTEVSDDYQLEALERQFRRMNNNESSEHLPTASSSSSSSSLSSSSAAPMPSISGELRKLHANLEARLQPFWSSVLPNRWVRIYIFAAANEQNPIASSEVATATDGSFQARFRLKWEEMAQHPDALHIAFGDPTHEHELLIVAELLPSASPNSSPASSSSDLRETAQPDSSNPRPSISSRISLTHAPIRVISDIDDTVKHSNVTGGARAVFHNVFVKDLSELIIPGVGHWYTEMHRQGVRFHYVSNGPFEILPVIGEFFKIAELPAGSLKLRSYAGRSLFSGLMSAPAARKRAGVIDILDAFPDSKFILIGDSGEQDLELYSELANEKPNQVVAVFIRDCDTGEPLVDPLGLNMPEEIALRSAPPGASDTPRARPRRDTPKARRSMTDTPRASELNPISVPYATRSPPATRSPNSDYFTPDHYTAEPDEAFSPKSVSSTSGSPRTPYGPSRTRSHSSVYSNLSPEEKRRYDLQMRVYKARMLIPRHIPFRIFRKPEDCIETQRVLGSVRTSG